jgi:hypothetical protein
MRNRIGIIGGVALGAGYMYLFDPVSGGRRRALARDKLVHLAHQASSTIDISSRDLSHRLYGITAETRHSIRTMLHGERVPDDVLVARVRSKLGRYVSHPHAIHVESKDGHIVLSGYILAHEINSLFNYLPRVRGLISFEDRLERHKGSDKIPSLQGGTPKSGVRPNILKLNWSPATRFVVGSTGTSMIYYSIRNRNVLGAILGTLGLGLIARSLSNMDGRRIFRIGHRRPLTIHKNEPPERQVVGLNYRANALK